MRSASRPGRAILGAAFLAVLILTALALEDITTGDEPDFTAEWAMVAVGAGLLVALITWLVIGGGRRRPGARGR